jgi:AbrB family looped-hinge helix DNA binding protein
VALTRRLQRTKKDQYTLTIPKALVELLGLKEQDELEFSLEGDRISLKKSKKKRGARDE